MLKLINIDSLSDNDLIDFVYKDIAGEYLSQNVIDWTNINKWINSVSELSKPVRYTYFIGILNTQILNGGFIQYYDNKYGIFALETLDALKEIKAFDAFRLLKQSIDILQLNNKNFADFNEYIIQNGYFNNCEIENFFDKLDDEYYNLEGKEDLLRLLADFLRKNKDEFK
jgi:hypothetical protein